MASHAVESFGSYKDVLEYAASMGRKVKKDKLYKDIKAGLLARQNDGSFLKQDVDLYLSSVKLYGLPTEKVEETWDLQKEKERQEIRRIKAVADKEEFLLAVKRGEYMPKNQVYMEFAGRAIVLITGLKAAYEARVSEIIKKCHGNMKDAPAVIDLLHEIQDMAFDEYSRDIEFTVEFVEQE